MKIRCIILLLATVGTARAQEAGPVLLSTNTALVTADVPAAVARHLASDWGTLLCVAERPDLWSPGSVLDHVDVVLPTLPDDAADAVDSMAAWTHRLGIDLVIVGRAGDPFAVIAAARQAGLDVFTAEETFQPGDVAIPGDDGYHAFRGPRSSFFSDLRSPWAGVDTDAIKKSSPGWRRLHTTAIQLAGVFSGGMHGTDAQLSLLLNASHLADSLADVADSVAATAARYADRWQALLGHWLRPVVRPDSIAAFAGIPTTLTLEIRSSVQTNTSIDTVLFPAESASAWHNAWPRTLVPTGRIRATGEFQIAGPGTTTQVLLVRTSYRGFQTMSRHGLITVVRPAVSLTLEPAIHYADASSSRDDPDDAIRVATGVVVANNACDRALDLELMWQAESPIEIAAVREKIRLSAGESRRLAYTLSMPRQLEYKEYSFDVRTRVGDAAVEATGHLWRRSPKFGTRSAVAVVGNGGRWRRALRAVGIDAAPVMAGSLEAGDLSVFGTVVVDGQTPVPTRSDVSALAVFVQSGRVAIVDLSSASAAWLPWNVQLVRWPGPFAASFHKEELNWWQAPNGLVGGCFASPDRDSVETLPPGVQDWESLLIDSGGKGFMYRRRYGGGWYVVVHSGWGRRVADLDRRALLGLVNLVSTRDL